jgi:hypothetical protein
MVDFVGVQLASIVVAVDINDVFAVTVIISVRFNIVGIKVFFVWVTCDLDIDMLLGVVHK